jgi:hypothetical protein
MSQPSEFFYVDFCSVNRIGSVRVSIRNEYRTATACLKVVVTAVIGV